MYKPKIYLAILGTAIAFCAGIIFFAHPLDSSVPPTPSLAEITAQPLFPLAPQFEYIEIMESCGPNFIGDCVAVRSGPGTKYRAVASLRHGIVLKTSGKILADGHLWYRIDMNEGLLYPQRVHSAWYVASDFVRPFFADGVRTFASATSPKNSKFILVDRSSQMLYAYDGDSLFMKESVSTGLDSTPTPRGTFFIYKKTPTRYMQGPLPGVSTQYYDLPGVPWDLYFTKQGGAIHGAYWHTAFGREHSHGCVNLPLDKARELYDWADVGTKVVVRD